MLRWSVKAGSPLHSYSFESFREMAREEGVPDDEVAERVTFFGGFEAFHEAG